MDRWLLVLLVLLCYACTSTKHILKSDRTAPNEVLNEIAESGLSDHFFGFVLYDPIKDRKLIDINGDHLFTPASNAKILTYYVSRKILGDSIPAFDYAKMGDSIIVRGSGDHYLFGQKDHNLIMKDFIKNEMDKVFWSPSPGNIIRFGSGWAWDDYQYSYQKEISMMSLYDNEIIIEKHNDSIIISPTLFYNEMKFDFTLPLPISKQENTNTVLINPYQLKDSMVYRVPMSLDQDLIKNLLSSGIQRQVHIIDTVNHMSFDTYYRYDIDSTYHGLMVDSDNYIAEQLMLCVAHEKDSIHTVERGIAIGKTIIGNEKIRWVDGSGLSRYNLISPTILAETLDLILSEFGENEIKKLFPSGHKGSTLDSIFIRPYGETNKGEGFIYAKTGTLSNNHNLSGYIYCKSGRVLIFSMMNNHFLDPKKIIVNKMHKVLSEVYRYY